MQREIKFRGKRIDNGDWAYGYLAYSDTIIDTDQDVEYEVDPSTTGQYTGLKDKNGNEIYEGDILGQDCSMVDNYTGKISIEVLNLVVRWSNEGLRWSVFCPSSIPKSDWGYIPKNAYVIGNIYQHPHLIPVPATQPGNG